MSIWKKLFGGSTTSTPKQNEAPSADTQVTFKREVRKQHPMMPNIETITRTYSAQSREAAVAFLRKQKITEACFYVEVVTPSGIFGTDKMCEIYDSGGELPGDSSDLLDKPAPTTKRDTSQLNTPEWEALSQTFHDVAENGDLEKVKAMLKEHPNLVFSRITFFGDTPLHAAASNGHKDVTEFLLDKGADVNIRDQNDQTPLHDTAGKGHKEVVELLVARGADVNAKMHGGITPLGMASDKHPTVVELLRKHGGR